MKVGVQVELSLERIPHELVGGELAAAIMSEDLLEDIDAEKCVDLRLSAVFLGSGEYNAPAEFGQFDLLGVATSERETVVAGSGGSVEKAVSVLATTERGLCNLVGLPGVAVVLVADRLGDDESLFEGALRIWALPFWRRCGAGFLAGALFTRGRAFLCLLFVDET